MNAITVNVMQKHITDNSGYGGEYFECMISHALWDVGFDCGVGGAMVWFPAYEIDLPVPDSIESRIMDWTEQKPVKPFWFDIVFVRGLPVSLSDAIDSEDDLLSEIDAMLAGELEVSR